MTNFTCGTAVFYLPEFPFSGEIETSNLLLALDTFKHFVDIGQVSPLYNVVVVTANDRLVSQSDLLNEYYVRKMEEYGVEVRYGQTMTAVNKGEFSPNKRNAFLFLPKFGNRGNFRVGFQCPPYHASQSSQFFIEKFRIIGSFKK